eukprot:gene12299-biopygen8142
MESFQHIMGINVLSIVADGGVPGKSAAGQLQHRTSQSTSMANAPPVAPSGTSVSNSVSGWSANWRCGCPSTALNTVPFCPERGARALTRGASQFGTAPPATAGAAARDAAPSEAGVRPLPGPLSEPMACTSERPSPVTKAVVNEGRAHDHPAISPVRGPCSAWKCPRRV